MTNTPKGYEGTAEAMEAIKSNFYYICIASGETGRIESELIEYGFVYKINSGAWTHLHVSSLEKLLFEKYTEDEWDGVKLKFSKKRLLQKRDPV